MDIKNAEEDNINFVESGLKLLEDKELYFECSEVCEEISRHFELKGDLIVALNYSKLAINFKKHQTTLGVDQA